MLRSLPFLALLLVAGCPSSMSPDTPSLPDVPALPDAPLPFDAGTDAPLGMDTPAGPDDAPRSDSPLLPPLDSGDPFGDTGTVGPPAWVDLDVLTDGSMCPPLVPCGGDEIGTWDVTGGCFEVPIGDRLMACPGATIDATGRARGRVTFDGTTAVRLAQSEVVATIFVPALCAGFAGGCPGIQDLLQMQNPDSACADDGAGNCDCVARATYMIDDSGGYTIMGNEIVSALGHRWAYCVMGDTMRYEDSTPSGMREPGIIELGRMP